MWARLERVMELAATMMDGRHGSADREPQRRPLPAKSVIQALLVCKLIISTFGAEIARRQKKSSTNLRLIMSTTQGAL